MSTDDLRVPGIVTKASPLSVADTVARLKDVATAAGLTVFAVIDHAAAASTVGLELRETQVVVFGSPRAGTPVMDAVPLIALDLPLKVLVWADGDGTRLAYTAPATLAERYGLNPEQAARFAGIDALTDAATA